MPKKQPLPQNSPYPFHGFVDVRLTEQQLAGQKHWQVDSDVLLDALLKFVEEGFSVKFRYDGVNGCHQAAATGVDTAHDYCGWHLVGRGSSPEKALKQLLYIHYHLWEGVWPIGKPKQSRDDYE